MDGIYFPSLLTMQSRMIAVGVYMLFTDDTRFTAYRHWGVWRVVTYLAFSKMLLKLCATVGLM